MRLAQVGPGAEGAKVVPAVMQGEGARSVPWSFMGQLGLPLVNAERAAGGGVVAIQVPQVGRVRMATRDHQEPLGREEP